MLKAANSFVLHRAGNSGVGDVYLVDRGESWAITRDSECLNNNNEWEYEPMPSSRDDSFFKRCRWINRDVAWLFWIKHAKE